MAKEKKKILIVEDDRFLVKAYKIRFGKIGFDVAVEENGKSGLAKAKKFKPDLIILDLMLPKMNGFEFLAAAKKDEAIKNIPVLVLSVLGQKADKEKALSLGAKDYFVKTDYTLEEIVKNIDKYL